MKKSILALILLALIMTISACGTTPAATTAATTTVAVEGTEATTTTAETTAASTPTPVDITFVLDWTPNTNHTGVYSAVAQGYFAEQGLNVEIIQPTDGTSDTMVASGSAQFGISYQEGTTFARASGVPLVSLAAVIQHNTSGFAATKDKGIVTAKDFEGKKYGGWGSPIEEATIKYLMDKVGGDIKKVEILTSGSSDFFQTSATGQVDFAWIFNGWTGIEAKLKGIELDYIDLGKEAPVFDYYTPIIVTNEDMINTKSDVVARFMKAVCAGYEFAIANPDKAAEDLLAAAPELDRALVMESQKYLSALYKDDAAYWGEQKQEVWDRYMKWLFENGFIDVEPDMTKAYTNEYLTK